MGEQKLLAFARALMCKPELLYLDEWTESVDETASMRLINLVKEHKRKGGTVILVSHDMRIIRGLVDIAIVIINGKLSQQLTREEIAQEENLMRFLEKGGA